MIRQLFTLLSLYLFSTARRLFCLAQARDALEGTGLVELVAEVDAAIAADEATRQLEQRYGASSNKAEHGREASRLDTELDRALSALDESLAATVKAFSETSSRGKRAQALRDQIFPQGVGAVIRLPYVEEESTVRGMLKRLRTEPELMRAVSDLGVQEIVDRIGGINPHYRATLQVETPAFKEVQAARAAGQDAFRRIVIQLMAKRVAKGTSPAEVEALDEALRAVLAQNEAIKRHRRRRRRPAEVDPETGEELEADPTADDDAAVPAADVADSTAASDDAKADAA